MENLLQIKDGELVNASSIELAKAVVRVLDNKKAIDIKMLKIDNKTIIADYFVICAGNSSTHIKTLADEVDYQLSIGQVPYVRLEGSDSLDWKVVDAHDVIIHIFTNEAREFYKLEKLWADAEEIDITTTTSNS